MFFKYFGSKNQLPGFYISGKLVENGLIKMLRKIKSCSEAKESYGVERKRGCPEKCMIYVKKLSLKLNFSAFFTTC